MLHFCLGRGRSSRARTFRHRFWLTHLMIAGAMVYVEAADAQATARSELRLGIGTFLSRDRGWNFEEPIEVFAAVTRTTGSIDVEAGASVFKSFVDVSYPDVSPPLARPLVDGIAARLHLRAPSPGRSALSALAGAEVYHNLTDGEARSTTLAGAAGIGLSFGGARRGTLDLRYVRFAKPLGSSRGILPLTFAWRI